MVDKKKREEKTRKQKFNINPEKVKRIIKIKKVK
jgi:hypothetical protein